MPKMLAKMLPTGKRQQINVVETRENLVNCRLVEVGEPFLIFGRAYKAVEESLGKKLQAKRKLSTQGNNNQNSKLQQLLGGF